MGEGIFRKKSLEKISSPDSLDSYIRVANPSMWILLISIIIFLVGALIWGAFGLLENSVKTGVLIEENIVACYVDEPDIETIKEGMTVVFDDYKATIESIKEDYFWGYYCTLDLEQPVPDGTYEGKIIISSYRPLSFILN